MLREHLQTIQALCFEEKPRKSALASLENSERWLLYRELVRKNFYQIVHAALPRTVAAWGNEASDAAITLWLAKRGSRRRMFRELPEDFAEFIEPTLADRSPPFLRDLLRYETGLWSASHRPDLRDAWQDLDFNLPLALNPTCNLLSVDYAVHLNTSEAPSKQAYFLCVVRKADGQLATWELNAVAYDLMQAWKNPAHSLKQHIEAVTKTRAIAVDESFVAQLSGMLADFIERGIVLGSLKQATS